MNEPTNGTFSYRLARLEVEFTELEREMRDGLKEVHRKLDRLMIAIVGGLLTLSVSLVIVAATLLLNEGHV